MVNFKKYGAALQNGKKGQKILWNLLDKLTSIMVK